jgi:DNA-binding transcriptional LysR family regulator
MDWIKSFVVLTQYMNFSLAADQLFISQSTLSKHIKLLEQELNIVLLRRSTRKLKLTPAGEAFLSYATEAVVQYESMLLSLQEHTHSRGVRAAYMTAAYVYNYQNLFYQYHIHYPHIGFEVAELDMDDAVKALDGGRVDFALIRTSLLPNPNAYRTIPFIDDELVVLCNKKHPLSGRESVPFHDIFGEKTILLKFGMVEYKLIAHKYNLSESIVKPTILTNRAELIKDYVSATSSISIMVKSQAEILSDQCDLQIVGIQERPQMSMGLIMRPGQLSPDAAHFLEYVHRFLKQEREDAAEPAPHA